MPSYLVTFYGNTAAIGRAFVQMDGVTEANLKSAEASLSTSHDQKCRITGAVQLDEDAQPYVGLHLNCIDSSAMPPVDSPLIIEIQPGMLVNAKRTAHAAAKGDDLVYELQHGGLAIGRFRWTHQ